MNGTSISLMIAGLLVGIVGGVLGVYALVNRDSGQFWFFWIAPLLAIGFALIMLQLVVGYYVKVGRLEHKGRRKA